MREILLPEWNWKQNLKFRIKACLSIRSLRAFLFPLRNIFVELDQRIENDATYVPLGNQSILIEPPEDQLSLPNYKSFAQTAERLKQHDAFLILQGSYADSTATPYSDYDIIVIGDILNPDVVKIVRELDILILKVDPLQHHGVIFIDIRSLDHYWQENIPLIVFESSITFTSAPVTLLVSKVIDDKQSSKAIAVNFLNGLSEFLENNTDKLGKVGLWKFKFFLSQLMLLPTLVLNSNNEFVSKKESFEICQLKYSEDAWHCMVLASEVRQNWPSDYNKSLYLTQRKSARSRPNLDPQQIESINGINIFCDPNFNRSLKLFIDETKEIIGC